ncbi:hypothetical protein [Fimbriimonas ginsengisoli]|nr:hypothetical protein [Fimbriimonas ginsengisoli]
MKNLIYCATFLLGAGLLVGCSGGDDKMTPAQNAEMKAAFEPKNAVDPSKLTQVQKEKMAQYAGGGVSAPSKPK